MILPRAARLCVGVPAGRPAKAPTTAFAKGAAAEVSGNVEGGIALVSNAAQASEEGLHDMTPSWPHARREAVMATIIPCNGRLGVSYTYDNGDAETGPIGPDDWPIIGLLKRQGKISFTSQLVRERFEAASQSAMMKGCYPMLQGALRRGSRVH
jgi:hypothetical protein